jgi:CDP-glucose 4,6-dehydratase
MIGAFADSFSGRSVFITGHTGFKGSWLALWLSRLGAKVTGYSTPPPTTPNNFEVSQVKETLAAHHDGDVRDDSRLSQALRDAAPDVVFHLAAQSLVRESYRSPAETFDVNVMGTVGLLEVVRGLRRPCIVIVVTSDKCYENRDQGFAYREGDPMGGFDPYSASKGAAELVTASYRCSFFQPDRISQHGVQLASARAGNVIGGGDWAKDRIVTDMVECLTANRPIPVRNPGAVRPWQHVLEPLSGYLTLAARMLEREAPELCGPWNFGPANGAEAPVRLLVETFLKSWGAGSWSDASDPIQPHEARLLSLSIDKASGQLGWKPRWGLEDAVERTARWYRRFIEKRGCMREACLSDISAYEGTG